MFARLRRVDCRFIGSLPSRGPLRNTASSKPNLDIGNALPRRRAPLEFLKEGTSPPRSGDSTIEIDENSRLEPTRVNQHKRYLKSQGNAKERNVLYREKNGKEDGNDDSTSLYKNPKIANLTFNLRNFENLCKNATERFMLLKTIVRDDAKNELIFTLEFSNLLLSIWRSLDELRVDDRRSYNAICHDLSRRIWSILPNRKPGVSKDVYTSMFAFDLEALDEGTLKPPKEQIQHMNSLIENLKPILETSVGGVLHTFGSCSNGLWVRGSDIDFCMVIPNCKTKRQWISKLSLVQSSLLNTDYISKINIIMARVPIAKLFDKNGADVCDVSINNTVALRNSLYVKTMTSIDDRVVKLGRFIKYWATCRKINNRAEGTMSSYTLSLQLFYFLANTSPPVLPPFRDIEVIRSEGLDDENFQECNFITNIEEIRSRCAYLGTNRESVTELLFSFFDYYGGERFQGGSSGATVSIYDNEVTSNDKGVLVMMCPISGKNVNPFTVKVWQSIHDEFKRFKEMVSAHQPIETICQVLTHSALKTQAERKRKNANIMANVLENAKELQKLLPKNQTSYIP